MGTSISKESEDGSLLRRRSSQHKVFQIENISRVASNLKNEIDQFLGDRNSLHYKEIQNKLATLSIDLQQIRTHSKKQTHRDRCDEIQGQIQNCIQRLETKINFNEQNANLDLGSVESNSFIRQAFKSPTVKDINELKKPNFESLKSLNRIEKETQNLERDIKNLIELEDVKQFIIHENKIKILCIDLEMIRVDDDTLLREKKADICKKLTKYNHLIKKIKRDFEKKNQTLQGSFIQPKYIKEVKSDSNELSKVVRALKNLEIQAHTFEGTRGDKSYKELEQILENYWTTVYSLDLIEDEERHKRTLTIETIKNILQELKKQADKNEKQANAIKHIHKIDQQLQTIKKNVENFQGTTTEPSYIKMDQDLRALWGKIGEIEEPNEHVRRSKERVINDIQHVLKNFAQESNSRASQIYENTSKLNIPENKIDEDEILQKQLLKQVVEFQNHWNQLNYNLDVSKITKSEYSLPIIDSFSKIMDSIQQKHKALSIIEKRKSTGSLVVAKVIDNTDQIIKVQKPEIASETKNPPVSIATYQSYYQPPDWLQQKDIQKALAQNDEDQIKVKPVVKKIGEMERVGTEAKSLLQQIRQSNCTKNDSEYKLFEAKLNQCRVHLENIEFNKKSDTLEGNRRRASKTINEAFRALEDKTILKQEEIRSSIAQDFMDIDAEIQYLKQQIANFTSVVKDNQYEKIKQGLSDCLNKLQVIDDMHISKQNSIRQIQQYHQELETKLAENQARVKISEQKAEIKRQTHQDIKRIIEQVQKHKLQIKRFSGVYDGLQYKQIEGNLKNCLDKLNAIDDRGDENLQNAVAQTIQTIQKYLIVLQDKSSKTVEEEPNQEQPKIQTQLQVDPNTPHHKINSLRDKLIVVKDQTETFSGKYNDEEYKEIEKQLLNYFDELKGIDDRGHRSVIISKEQYADYIGRLMQYFSEKAKLQDETTKEDSSVDEKKVIKINEQIQVKQSNQNFKIPDPTEELSVIEKKTAKIKNRVEIFSGTPEDDKYSDLKEDINNLIIKLDNVQVGNVAHVREIKKKLVLDLQDCLKGLKEKADTQLRISPEEQKQMDVFNETLREVEELEKEVNDFNGIKNDDKYCYLDEMLIRLTIKLDSTNTYGKADLRNARKKVIREIHKNMKLLSQKVAESETNQVGMIV